MINIPQYQQAVAAMLLATIVFGVGYTTADVNHVQDAKQFDQFAYKAKNDVNVMMQVVIAEPNDYNLLAANNKLKIEYTNWAKRENGQNKELFFNYLNACENVIDEMQAGNEPDLTKMNTLKNELI